MAERREIRTAVVGAGVVGLLSAWRLRLAGHAVTIVDPAPVSGASYAAAGMLAPISEVQYGQQELWPLMAASRTEYPELLATLEQATTTPTGYLENGTLLLAADPGDRAAVVDLVDLQQRHGMQVEPLTSSALRCREPALAPVAKAWDVPSDHQVDPRQLARCATAALSADLSGTFPEAGPAAQWVAASVTEIEHEAGRVRLTTGDGHQIQADKALLVPGLGYNSIGGIPQRYPLHLRPVHGDVLRLRVRPSQLLPGESHVLSTTVRAKVGGRSVYLVPRAHGGLVVGASSREDDLADTHAGSVLELLEDAATVLPAVREMQLEEITTRARPGTPDDRPYLGLLAADEGDGAVVVSTGFSRHGILLAPLAARLAAALLGGTTSGTTGLNDTGLDNTDQQLLETMSPAR